MDAPGRAGKIVGGSLTGRQAGRHAGRQAGRQVGRQAGRQTGKQLVARTHLLNPPAALMCSSSWLQLMLGHWMMTASCHKPSSSLAWREGAGSWRGRGRGSHTDTGTSTATWKALIPPMLNDEWR